MTHFPAKLLLFGEYVIIKGAQALAVPFPKYSGQWGYGEEVYSLEDFGNYIEKLHIQKHLLAELDIAALQAAIRKGLAFESTIPSGYGVGSSGALVAAIYHVYCNAPQTDLLELKRTLAQLESFFHGASSGTDPLVSYLKKGIWIQDAQTIELIDASVLDVFQEYTFFLIDTGISRSTNPLVQTFNAKFETNTAFRNLVTHQLTDLNNAAIVAFLQKKETSLWMLFQQIGSLQYQFFQEMIPSAFQALWKNSLDSDIFSLKLCGAGGGGFILGMTPDFEQTRLKLSGYVIQKITTSPNPPIPTLTRIF